MWSDLIPTRTTHHLTLIHHSRKSEAKSALGPRCCSSAQIEQCGMMYRYFIKMNHTSRCERHLLAVLPGNCKQSNVGWYVNLHLNYMFKLTLNFSGSFPDSSDHLLQQLNMYNKIFTFLQTLQDVAQNRANLKVNCSTNKKHKTETYLPFYS